MSALGSVSALINEQQSPTPVPANRWLISPIFDLLFVCGLAPWILGVLAYFVIGPIHHQQTGWMQHELTIPFVVASLLIGEGHQFTSIIRYYFGFNARKKRYIWQRIPIWLMYLGLGMVALAIAGINFSESPFGIGILEILRIVTGFGAFLFPCFLLHHFCAQAKAIGQIYCAIGDYRLSPAQKVILELTTWFLILAGLLTVAAPLGFNFSLESIDSMSSQFAGQFLIVQQLFVAAAEMFTFIFLYLTIRRGIRKAEWMPLGAGLLWANLAFWILCPVPELIYAWIFVPLFYHATQHWSLAWHVKQKEALAKSQCEKLTSWRCLQEFLGLVVPVTAICLVVLFGITTVDTRFGDGTLALEWSMVVFYFHYFADRIVWRPQQ